MQALCNEGSALAVHGWRVTKKTRAHGEFLPTFLLLQISLFASVALVCNLPKINKMDMGVNGDTDVLACAGGAAEPRRPSVRRSGRNGLSSAESDGVLLK